MKNMPLAVIPDLPHLAYGKIGNPESKKQHLDSRLRGNDNKKNTHQINHNPRYLAAQIIARWLTSDDFPNRLLNIVAKDRAFVTEIVQGVVRWKRPLEWVIKQTAKHVPPPLLKSFLLTGLYQLLMMDKVADYAAVNETVAAAKIKFSSKQADFVNAVLRRAIRDREKTLAEINGQPPGIRYSHPDLLIHRWTKIYGAKETFRLCEWNNTRPNIIIRINTLKPGDQIRALVSQLEQKGVLPVKGPGNYFPLPHGLRIEDLPGYTEGLFLIIDPFASNAIELLNPQPGENILDACAAPGGKTFLIAEKMRGSGKLHAFDVSEDRIRIMKTNFQRLQVSDFIEIKKQNILSPIPADNQQYDRILADVPCSNTGVIRRKPDIRWRFSLKGLGLLVKTQKEMLDRLALILKDGGTLVYSTCSLEPEENQMLVRAWLGKNPSFQLTAEKKYFPPRAGTDGGYAAAIVKR
ncbi:MAG: 16S rRNA (cytosine(967)-C(5))-methyltransferase RsmB [Kiritimatiellia bacterium]|nr:16S rRNA (cytosine(967)-C(5))-methyltransferase RsmB [Kiritimatiellia bacterium]